MPPTREPDRPEALLAQLVAAVDLGLKGDWQGAHLVAQDHEGDSMADWLHAVAHRMEGDLDNARYWYGRCGTRVASGCERRGRAARDLRAALGQSL